ncbi:hypothetical protein [Ectopseudomonas alcaliphila]|uniref:Uncharacterized protein n=1 Tax=Ectopseudomonas alcaliphila TaxID=101564 RepID=A0ABU4Q5B9_9GAMM|nr:hypothetical protein [Pseudomonas alcaliphila]MDX5995372.1 hypothetical protein [Pseudomonas alcaliphila]
MDIRIFEPMSTRPCKYCLALQDDAVFADFQINETGKLYLVRISYDGYGCCEPEIRIMGIEITNTNQLISAIESNNLNTQAVTEILSGYFRAHKGMLWENALLEYKLI